MISCHQGLRIKYVDILLSHNKIECTKPRVFKGACRICDKEGHPASECPDKPADVCKNCKQEGNIHAIRTHRVQE